MQNNSMTEIIYDYFSSRILFGYFLPGEQLPSIQYICRQFQVNPLTVRTALLRLREEGVIETTERKRSTVTYQPDEQQEQRYRAAFLSRREGMDDMCRNSGILFDPIARLCLQKQTEDSIHQIRSQLKKRKGHPAKQVNMFYAEAMRPLNNPLVLNLHWEMVRYLRTPYLQHPANFDDAGAAASEHIERMLGHIEARNVEKAVEAMQAFDRDVMQRFFASLDVMLDAPEPVEQVRFEWQIYREHPQLCYTLAAELMSKIDARVYKQEALLPSCQALAPGIRCIPDYHAAHAGAIKRHPCYRNAKRRRNPGDFRKAGRPARSFSFTNPQIPAYNAAGDADVRPDLQKRSGTHLIHAGRKALSGA